MSTPALIKFLLWKSLFANTGYIRGPEVCGFLIEVDAVPDCNVDMTHMRDRPQFLLNVMLISGSSFEWSEFAEVPINN